jgi:uncharacterized protein (TIGR01777 family)
MRILLTGGTGFIGTALAEALLSSGCELIILSRGVQTGVQTGVQSAAHADRTGCRFIRSLDEIAATEPLDAVINLAGASLAARRWSPGYKREIVASRTGITRQLLDLFARLECPPEALLSASAIGYYGPHGDEYLTETSALSSSTSAQGGFAQRLCSDWEALALQANQYGVRVCLLRLGVVLDSGGGALLEMAKSFRFGVASWLGSGEQWLSWVHRLDVVRAIQFLLQRDDLQGPFNITGPVPVTGRDFALALQAHHRTFLRAGVPATVLRVLVGEMADELLLSGQRVLPHALESAGFTFSYPSIQGALAAIYADHVALRIHSSSRQA